VLSLISSPTSIIRLLVFPPTCHIRGLVSVRGSDVIDKAYSIDLDRKISTCSNWASCRRT